LLAFAQGSKLEMFSVHVGIAIQKQQRQVKNPVCETHSGLSDSMHGTLMWHWFSGEWGWGLGGQIGQKAKNKLQRMQNSLDELTYAYAGDDGPVQTDCY
jgi:hypothetical protein